MVELSETPALGTLAAVHALHLVAAERERQLVLVLGHVARQRHRQVEAQRQFGQAVAALLERPRRLHEIHLPLRSEEHTSELQSLMRISYAVFCLKKKTTTKHKYITNNLH